MKTQTTAGQKLEAARLAIQDGEARNLGRAAMARRWNAFFAAEDATKGTAVWS